jgi:hypothetical protein
MYRFVLLLSALFPLALSAQLRPTNQEMFSELPLPTPGSLRTASGKPGTQYWQQRADYWIQVMLDAKNHKLSGSQRITYTNNSPETLEFVWLQLEQNKFAPDSRGSAVSPENGRWRGAFKNGGYQLSKVEIEQNGKTYTPKQIISDTNLQLWLNEAMPAGGSTIVIKLEWSFEIPQFGADRLGRYNARKGWVYELAQWYPKMYVFDDQNGWNVQPYLGQGEFYLEYGDFDLAITVPRDMIVVATGSLQNEAEVFTAEQVKRLAAARQSEKTVLIRSAKEVDDKKSRPAGNGPLTWRFRAENVRDVAWAASAAFIYDAASWNGVLMQSAYPEEGLGTKENPGWEESTAFTLHSIRFYSKQWFTYPYPVAINVGGTVSGMEYPMIVFCSVESRGKDLWGVTDHEFGHQWFPMIVGNDERRNAWMDEGFNTFMNFYSETAFYGPGGTSFVPKQVSAMIAEQMQSPLADQPINTHPDCIRRNGLGMLAYYKPGYGLVLLREVILGPEKFDLAFRTYINQWKYKHPSKADFYRTMENAAGEDLDWFWRGWFETTSTLDIGISSVVSAEGLAEIRLENKGKLVMPVPLEITLKNGSTIRKLLPADIWRTSNGYNYVLETADQVVSVSIDPEGWLPDTKTSDNSWKQN